MQKRSLKKEKYTTFFNKFKFQYKDLNYGKKVLSKWAVDALQNIESPEIIDLGYAEGEDLYNISEKCGKKCKLYGVDFRDEGLYSCNFKNIDVIRHVKCDLETDVLPFTSSQFDLVILNQILEHSKDIFWVLSEAVRICKKNGHIIVGVPNLAAIHNRIMLLLGKQPSCIKVLGPHVRGFTKKDMIKFLEVGNILEVKEYAGGGGT